MGIWTPGPGPTSGADNFVGDDTDEVASGGAGADVLSGGGGADTLDGGGDIDSLSGGDGNDILIDTSGAATAIDGGAGDDTITLGSGLVSGTINGGDGADQVTVNGALNALQFVGVETLNTNGSSVFGTAAQFEAFSTIRRSEALPGNAVNLRLTAAGILHLADELRGSAAVVTGTNGNDVVVTSDGNDIIYGLGGLDTLAGGNRNDILYGGDGNDTLLGGGGADLMDGGAGLDVVSYETAGVGVTVNLSVTTAQSTVGGGVDTLIDIESIVGSAHNDTLTGNAADNQIAGRLGNDTLNGGDGNDLLLDEAGTTTNIDGGAGDDSIVLGTVFSAGSVNGGAGTDQLRMFGDMSVLSVSGIEILNVTGGVLTATVEQLESFDTIRAFGSEGIRLQLAASGYVNLADELFILGAILDGSSGNDVVVTGFGSDFIDGEAGNDIIFGAGGGDSLSGGSGDDLVGGGSGNDFLEGGIGLDTIDGGIGDDHVRQFSTDGRDVINGGDGLDTYELIGVGGGETFRILTRTAALDLGITGLSANTEIVITRNGTDNASIVAELDNIEEIEVAGLIVTENDGDGVLGSGPAEAGATIIVAGDFTATSLDYSTIRITGTSANDVVDISGLASAHRVVFESSGGVDRVVGNIRPQDQFNGVTGGVFGASDAFGGMFGSGGIERIRADVMEDRALLDFMLDVTPVFDRAAFGHVELPTFVGDASFFDWNGGDGSRRLDLAMDILLAV